MARVFQLREVPLFTGLGADELWPVAEITSEVHVAAGGTVFEAGDRGDKLYLISKGRVEVLADGRRIAELGVGECFGEMALLDGAARSATIRCLDDTVLVATPREDFLDLLELYPAIARAVASVLVTRLREAISRRSSIAAEG